VAAVTNVNQPVGNAVEFEIFSGYNPLPEETGVKGEGAAVHKPVDFGAAVVRHDRKPVKP
jgi:hypothetical protein